MSPARNHGAPTRTETPATVNVAFLCSKEPELDLVRPLRELSGRFESLQIPASTDSVGRLVDGRDFGMVVIDDRDGVTDSEQLLEAVTESAPSSAVYLLVSDLASIAAATRLRFIRKGAIDVVDSDDLLDPSSASRLIARAVGFSKRLERFAEYRRLVEHAQDVITLLGPDGEIRYESPSIRESLGYDPADMVGKDPFSFIHPDDRDSVYRSYLEQRTHPGATRTVEYRFRHADGHWCYLESRSKVVPSNGEEAVLIISSRDVSDRRATVEALELREKQLADAQRLTHLGSWHWNVVTGELDWSDEMYRIYGFEPGSPLSFERYTEGIHPADRDQVRKTVADAIERRQSFHFVHRVVRPNGEERFVEGRGEVRLGEREKVVEMFGTGHDITELHESRSGIEDSERRFRTLFESSPDAIIVLRADGTVQDANPAAAALFGSDREWLTNRTYVELCPPEDRDEAHHEFDRLRDGGISATTRGLISRDGDRFPVEMHVNSITLNDRSAVLLYMRDISERLEREQVLRLLGRRQEAVLERERERISREVHDVLGQTLTALRTDAAWVGGHLGDERTPERVDQMCERIDELIETVRRIAHDLRPGILDDFGLAAAIEWHAKVIGERMGLKSRIGMLDNPEIPGELTTAVFRIYQELFTNVARHASASEFEVSLSAPADNLVLTVKDDGTGIDPEKLERSESLGLLGIRERLDPWGGRLEFDSAPGRGTRVEVIIPLTNNQPIQSP